MAEGGGPWYKKKFPRVKYVQKGEPRVISDKAMADDMRDLFHVTDEEQTLWEDARTGVKNKNKKREFHITTKEPFQLPGQNKYRMTIEVLHTDYQGFEYTAEAKTIKELEMTFWTTVQKMMAYYCGPKIKPPPAVFDML